MYRPDLAPCWFDLEKGFEADFCVMLALYHPQLNARLATLIYELQSTILVFSVPSFSHFIAFV